MKKVNLKYLDLTALSIISPSEYNCNSVILITNFGYIIGEIHVRNIDDTSLSLVDRLDLARGTSMEIVKEEHGEVSPVDANCLISLKNAKLVYSNGDTFNFNEFAIYADQVVGFAPLPDDYLEN